eukprot:scaffold4101_cov155-Ochromonas_danica.AAC.2
MPIGYKAKTHSLPAIHMALNRCMSYDAQRMSENNYSTASSLSHVRNSAVGLYQRDMSFTANIMGKRAYTNIHTIQKKVF